MLYAFALTGRYGFFVFQLPRVSLCSALGYGLAALSGRSRIRGTCPYAPSAALRIGKAANPLQVFVVPRLLVFDVLTFVLIYLHLSLSIILYIVILANQRLQSM